MSGGVFDCFLSNFLWMTSSPELVTADILDSLLTFTAGLPCLIHDLPNNYGDTEDSSSSSLDLPNSSVMSYSGRGGSRQGGRWAGSQQQWASSSSGNRGRDERFGYQHRTGDQDDDNYRRSQKNPYRGRQDRSKDRHGDETGGGGRGRERPPPGLKGREIGMWHARRSQARKERENKLNRPTVSMDKRKEQNIRNLLTNLQDSEYGCEPDLPDQQDQQQHQQNHEQQQPFFQHRNPRPRKDHGSTFWSDRPSSSQTPSWGSAASASQLHAGKSKKPHSDPESDNEDNQTKIFWRGGTSTSTTEFVYTSPKKESVPDSWDELLLEEGDSFPVEVVPPAIFNRDPEIEGPDMMECKSFEETVDQHQEFRISAPVTRNEALDQLMCQKAQDMLGHSQFIKMMDFRRKLPSYTMKKVIEDTVRNNQVLVISGETGCGKTTQVPQFILDDYTSRGCGSQCSVICTQPRRISAISVAERVAAERCEKVNDSQTSAVGYQIRLETKRPRSQGSILFCTTGIVLKFLENDPRLSRATHVIIDEIHERDLQSDFLMIILKDLLPLRPDLKVILMSATLNADMFSQYFNSCPMLNIPGYTFPVKEYLLEDIIEMTNYQQDKKSTFRPRGMKRETQKDRDEKEDYMVWLRNQQGKYSHKTIDVLRQFDFSMIDLDLMFCIINHICTSMDEGAILVFVPGWEEIKKLNEMILSLPRSQSGSLRVLPLHSLMPTVNQREIFERPPPGVRKIVIATNIAETSITIDDVVFVIDCGKIKVKDFDPEVNLTSLEPQWVSKANARQRRGRAGRVQAGHCFHLFTGHRLSLCMDYLPPEMLRTRLEELCLQIKLLKLGRIVPFISKAMQHPSMEAITHAVTTLQELNALDDHEELLPLGYHLARMPVEPHTGKMILFGAMFGCLDPILTVAASLSFKDAFTIPLGKEIEADRARKKLAKGSKSDHLMLINAFSGWEDSLRGHESSQYCWLNFLSENTLKMLRDMKKQLTEIVYDTGFISSKNIKDPAANLNSNNLSLLRAVLCAGLYPNVAQVIKVPKPNKQRGGTVTMVSKDDTRVMAHPKSVNAEETFFESKWMVYYKKLKTSKVYVHDCTMVSPYPLLFFGGKINILKEDKMELVSVDDWVKFKAAASTAQLVKELRGQLDKLLTRKITSPGPTSWDSSTSEGALMAAIADLISTEQRGGGSIGQESEVAGQRGWGAGYGHGGGSSADSRGRGTQGYGGNDSYHTDRRGGRWN